MEIPLGAKEIRDIIADPDFYQSIQKRATLTEQLEDREQSLAAAAILQQLQVVRTTVEGRHQFTEKVKLACLLRAYIVRYFPAL